MEETNPRAEKIIKSLSEKGSTKQQVFQHTLKQFEVLKKVLTTVSSFYQEKLNPVDERVEVKFMQKGYYDAKLKVGGDMLLFHMHTNVFGFDKKHPLWKKGYVQEDPLRSYCGMINIYNFLSDSFKYNRMNDAGYLIARVFVNKENHFFLDGKKQLGFKFNDFANATLTESNWKEIVEEAILFALEFDLLTPNYHAMSKVSISQILELTKNMKLRTDKRLGFRFGYEEEGVK